MDDTGLLDPRRRGMGRRRRPTSSRGGRVGRADRLAQRCRGRLLMRPSPEGLQVVIAHLALLVNGAVKLGRMVGLGVQLRDGAGLSPILVCRACNLLPRARLEYV